MTDPDWWESRPARSASRDSRREGRERPSIRGITPGECRKPRPLEVAAAEREHGDDGRRHRFRVGKLAAVIFVAAHRLEHVASEAVYCGGFGHTCEKSFPFGFLCGNKSLRKGFSFSKSSEAITGNLG